MRRKESAQQQAELARLAGLQISPEAAARIAAGNERLAEKPKRGWKQHTRLGRALEARLDAQHAAYECQRRACMVRQHVQVKWLRGKATVVGPAIVDYLGTVASGLGVAIEAKGAASGIIDLLDPDTVEPHQVAYMRRHLGVGLYVICFGPLHRADAVLVPAQAIIETIDRATRARTTARWREADALAAGGVRLRGVDWLGAAPAFSL